MKSIIALFIALAFITPVYAEEYSSQSFGGDTSPSSVSSDTQVSSPSPENKGGSGGGLTREKKCEKGIIGGEQCLPYYEQVLMNALMELVQLLESQLGLMK